MKIQKLLSRKKEKKFRLRQFLEESEGLPIQKHDRKDQHARMLQVWL